MPVVAEERVGPYRLLGEIGRGGGGLVYKAQGEDGLVALKTVPPGTRLGYAALRRECLALMALRHEGLVNVVDEGLGETPPWYAMDLLDGPDLLRYARDGWNPGGGRPAISQEALRKILSACRRLCEPLAYLHGEGIVHRDIKPENVVVTGSEMPVLLDLGLVSRFSGREGRDSLETLGGSVGTALYMAPEQWRGEEVDARADLFSLGVILYYLLTGKAPFATRRDLLEEDRDPASPSRLVVGLPPELDGLVGELLARDPLHRLGRAEEAGARLAKMIGDRPDSFRPAVLLFRPALQGRERESRFLEDFIEGERSRLLVIQGESGAGKTRMALELAALAARRRHWILRSEAEGGASPLSAFRGILRFLADYCLAAGEKESRRLFGDRLLPLAPFEPLLPSVGEAPPLPPEAARERLFVCLAECLEILARERRLLLLIDDFHRADDLSWAFLGRLALGVHGVKTAITRRADRAIPFRLDVAGMKGVSILDLERLASREIGGMAVGMLAGDALPDRFRGFLFRCSEGNPMFAAEYLRMALQEDYLVRGEDGRWRLTERFLSESADKMPTSLMHLAARRLKGLSKRTRALLEMVALFDREVTLETVALALDLPAREAAGPWRELVAKGLLREAEDGRLKFVHQPFRMVACEAIAPLRRKRLHGAAAKALEALPEGPPQRALAWHQERAGRIAAARRSYLAAATEAMRGFALDEAEDCYRRCLDLTKKPGRETLDALLGCGGEVLKLKGRLDEAEPMVRRALALAKRLNRKRDQLKAIALLAELTSRRGDVGEARRLYRKALETASRLGRRREEASILDGLAILEGQAGFVEEATRLFDHAILLHRKVKAVGREGRALASMASLRHNQGELKEAEALYRRALTLLRKAGDRRGAAVVLVNLGVSAAALGNGEAAAKVYGEAAREARSVGDRRLLARILLNFATYRQTSGLPEAAMRLYEKAVKAAAAVFDRVTEGIAESNMGELCLDRGNDDAAMAHLVRARDLLGQAGERRFLGHAECHLGELERRRGSLAEALPAFERALAIAKETKDRHGEANAAWRLAALARERGDREALLLAEQALGMAREIGEPQLHILCLAEQAACRPEAALRNLEEAMGCVRRMGTNPSGEVARCLEALRALVKRAAMDSEPD